MSDIWNSLMALKRDIEVLVTEKGVAEREVNERGARIAAFQASAAELRRWVEEVQEHNTEIREDNAEWERMAKRKDKIIDQAYAEKYELRLALALEKAYGREYIEKTDAQIDRMGKQITELEVEIQLILANSVYRVQDQEKEEAQ